MLGLFHSQIEPQNVLGQLFTYSHERQWFRKGSKKGPPRFFSRRRKVVWVILSSRGQTHTPRTVGLPPAALAGLDSRKWPQRRISRILRPAPTTARNSRTTIRAAFSTRPGHGRAFAEHHRWRGGFTPTTETRCEPRVGARGEMSET